MDSGNEILFVSSYPPRECGIATYTQDLIHAVKEKFGSSFSLKVCALESKNEKREYPDIVKYKLTASDSSGYISMAEKINSDKNVKLVFIQHEFGLFEGKYGENLLYFMYTLNKPILVSFHTVLPAPDDKRRKIVQSIVSASEGVVVMTKRSSELLQKDYGITPEKITVIHHGTHLVCCPDKNTIKKKYGLDKHIILSTFGLLSSGKSIETAIDALPVIANKYPNVIYMIIGKTHPEVLKCEGEKYRESLEERIKKLEMEEHVRFVNRYLSLDVLLEYLQLTDIYLFTSKDPNQAVSGTFSYAMGSACPVISTPIPHAKEMLSGNAGIIVDFKNPSQLAEATIKLLSDKKMLKEMILKALHRIRPTAWQNSAVAHAELFRKTAGNKFKIKYSPPEISLNHIKRLTTERGIIQFSKICRPDLDSGYTLDDNARALIAVTKHYELTGDRSAISLINTYLDFIKYAQQSDGKFLNYIDKYNIYQVKNNYVNLEDSMGRAIWALGDFISHQDLFPNYITRKAERILLKSTEALKNINSPRAIAFAIKGLFHYNHIKKNEDVSAIIKDYCDYLILLHNQVVDGRWDWFEENLTYANSVLPEALLFGYLETGEEKYKEIAKSTFDFLLSLTFSNNQIKVISNRGWHKRGDMKKRFGEQPIDVAYTISALDLFYQVFNEKDYKEKMNIAFSWFHGNNHLHQIIYNPVTGGCQDGLEEINVNLNQGAESTICYLLARLVIENYILIEEKIKMREFCFAPVRYNEIKTRSINEMTKN